MATPRVHLARRLLHLRRRPRALSLPFSPSPSAHGPLPGPSLWPPPSPLAPPGGAWGRAFHDGRPRGPLWRSKKLIGKEALFAIQGLKRFKGDEEKLADFVRRHVARLLKADKLAVLGELERQEEVDLAVKVRPFPFFSLFWAKRLFSFIQFKGEICAFERVREGTAVK
jgi:hypothetical protein